MAQFEWTFLVISTVVWRSVTNLSSMQRNVLYPFPLFDETYWCIRPIASDQGKRPKPTGWWPRVNQAEEGERGPRRIEREAWVTRLFLNAQLWVEQHGRQDYSCQMWLEQEVGEGRALSAPGYLPPPLPLSLPSNPPQQRHKGDLRLQPP